MTLEPGAAREGNHAEYPARFPVLGGDPPALPGNWPPAPDRFVPERERSTRVGDWSLIILTFILAFFSYRFTEKIGANNGLGHDGVTYGNWAKDFYKWIFVQRTDRYSIQRILPSAVVHYTLRLLHVSLTDRHVIHAFGTVNILLFTLGAYVWCRIADQLQIGRRGKWLGFIALFLNYAVLKWTAYYPVLTDTAAYTLGLLLLHCYLSGHTTGLCLFSVLGAFVWPTLLHTGAVLLLCPCWARCESKPEPARYHLNDVLALAVVLVALVYGRSVLRRGYLPPTGVAEPIFPVIRLSICVSLLYLFTSLRSLWNNADLLDPCYYLRRLFTLRGLLALALLAGVHVAQLRMALPTTGLSTKTMLDCTTITSIAKPGVFYLAHILYFGPALLLALFLWQPICRLIHTCGIGLALALSLGVVLSLNSESRRIINFIPFLVPFVIKATEELSWRPLDCWCFAGLSLLFSKVWLTLDTQLTGNFQEFPAQTLFMTGGPWMSNTMYLAQGAAVLLIGWWLYPRCQTQVMPMPTAKSADHPLPRAAA